MDLVVGDACLYGVVVRRACTVVRSGCRPAPAGLDKSVSGAARGVSDWNEVADFFFLYTIVYAVFFPSLSAGIDHSSLGAGDWIGASTFCLSVCLFQ